MTPYIAGSVIPITAVAPVDAANCLRSEFLLFTLTHNAAAPWQTFATNIPGKIVWYPAVANWVNIAG